MIPGGRANLEKILAVENGELAPAAARALGELGAADSEAALLAALERDVPGLRPEVAAALGRGASVGAVMPLREAAEQYPEGEFPRIARQAAAAIQARAAGAEHGQVSVVDGDEARGLLSLPDAEPGRVSVADGEAGRLSPARPARVRG